MTKELQALADEMFRSAALAYIDRMYGLPEASTDYSVEDICLAIGLSVPTLYAWFPGGIKGKVKQLLKD